MLIYLQLGTDEGAGYEFLNRLQEGQEKGKREEQAQHAFSSDQ